jgi:hypothetical protein
MLDEVHKLFPEILPDNELLEIAVSPENFLMLDRLCELFGDNPSFRESLSEAAEQSSSEEVKVKVREVLARSTPQCRPGQ